MKLLITGASGFIGSHLCHALRAEGHDVGIVCTAHSNLAAIKGAAPSAICRSSDVSILIDFFQSHAFDGIVHLATYFCGEHQPDDIDRLLDANVIFGTHILEAASRSKIPWILSMGTTWQNFHGAVYDPVNLYAASKQAFEDIMRFYVSSGYFRAAILKLTDTYGPGDTRPKLLSQWKALAKTGALFPMSEGQQVIDLLHVDDVVRAIQRLVIIMQQGSEPFQDFVISSPQQMTLKELAKMVERIAEIKLNIQWGARPYREREVMNPAMIGMPVPGWEPVISLEEGIRSYFKLTEEN